MKHYCIKRIFTDLEKLKFEGIWLNGTEGDGEYKSWHENGKLFIHCFFKNDEVVKDYLP